MADQKEKPRHRWLRQAVRLVAEADPSAAAIVFDAGDVVEPRRGTDAYPLHIGTQRYTDAVVASLSPFRLMSFSGSVSCDTIKPQDVRRISRLSEREIARLHLNRGREIVYFDVAVVRAHCERLVAAEAHRAADYQVFCDWARAQGRGPERKPCGACDGVGVLFSQDFDGTETPCLRCGSEDHPGTGVAPWPDDLPRAWAASHHDRVASAASGPGIARTAQRLLDTLNGRCPWAPSAQTQASECDRCGGGSATELVRDLERYFERLIESRATITPALRQDVEAHVADALARHGHRAADVSVEVDSEARSFSIAGIERLVCFDCRSTGHNLAGFLPTVEHPRSGITSRGEA